MKRIEQTFKDPRTGHTYTVGLDVTGEGPQETRLLMLRLAVQSECEVVFHDELMHRREVEAES